MNLNATIKFIQHIMRKDDGDAQAHRPGRLDAQVFGGASSISRLFPAYFPRGERGTPPVSWMRKPLRNRSN
ncbi:MULTISPECIES: hypothetical protein [Thiorhodovibrio]|uniref:hypothetical protein n=1 Tax=Thiorhodovibrio TaxID=61593 RepID=UPI001911C9F8|nr:MULTISPECIES: hypothetical protein [Thiorhodovibrio]